MVTAKAFNRNLGIRHDNLLKELLKCGDCGGNFSVGGRVGDRKYRCYGTLKRGDKPRICNNGVELQMRRLNGLVLQLCIRKFAHYDLEIEASEKINLAGLEIQEKTKMLREYESRLQKEHDAFSAFVRRVLKSASNDEEARLWVEDERQEYDRKVNEITDTIARTKEAILEQKTKIATYSKMRGKASLIARQKEILSDKHLVSEYVKGFISNIVIYRVNNIWNLVIVHFMDGGESWGTIKNRRYKKTEVIVSDDGSFEYTGILIDNDDQSLRYESVSKTIVISSGSSISNVDVDIPVDFGEFVRLATDAGFLGSYPSYVYK